MKDTDLRGIMLQQFYERRREGDIGVGATNVAPLKVPSGTDLADTLRICEQLGEHGLINWSGDAHAGYGAGTITAFGVDVAEEVATSPIVIHIDQSRHEQNVEVSGGIGVQIAGAHSNQQQTVTHHVENLIRAIDSAPVPADKKQEAKSKLAEFLKTPAAGAVIGTGMAALLRMLGH